MGIAAAISEIAADLTPALPGVAVLDRPREGVVENLTAIVYFASSTQRLWTSDRGSGLAGWIAAYEVRIDLVSPRRDIVTDVDRLMARADAISNAVFAGFARDRFGGTVMALGDPAARGGSPVTVELVDGIWGEGTIGLRYRVTVTIEEDSVP